MTNNLAVSEWIIEDLIRQGITRFVISPGSRSTPLTVAVAHDPKAQTTVHFDERGAAYFALGYARATGKPAVLICTSGTAVANYFPAVVEASMDNIPLIILSADRPPELIDVGANQAIFQDNIYGTYPRLFKNLAPPDADTTPAQILAEVDDLHTFATGIRPGPVHLNCQFREPLLPEPNPVTTDNKDARTESPSPLARETLARIAPEKLAPILEKMLLCNRGLIIVGRGVNNKHNDAILNSAKALKWPVLPDVQSEIRFTNHPNVSNHFDLALLKDELSSQKPEMIIHLGGAFTSKRLLNYLNDPDIFYVSLKRTPEQIDPNHQVDVALQMEIDTFFQALEITEKGGNQTWLTAWQQAERNLSAIVMNQMEQTSDLNEPGISYHLSKLIPQNHSLMLANSMAIREMEMFGSVNQFKSQVFANRGASGIDGLLATAAGLQAGTDKPLTLLIGDLAALHDLNSLAFIQQSRYPIIIVLINNNGGGIFNFLPVESETDVFETYFGTPHDRTFENAAKMFALDYAKPVNMSDFQQLYSQAARGTQSIIIELLTDRYENHKLHLEIFNLIRGS